MTAVIIAPGGSYRALSMNNEGRAPANYLNALGIAAFVLRYRLGPQYHHPIELGDAQRAIRTVRARAAEWHIAPDRIGMMGFSAGGHLASTRVDALRPRQRGCGRSDRSRQQPARFRDPRLSGDHVHRSVDASGLEDQSARRRAGSGAGAQPVERNAGDRVDAADVHLPHQRRHGRAGREQPSTISSRCGRPACRPRCTSSRTARTAPACGMQDPALAEWPTAARELAARQPAAVSRMVGSDLRRLSTAIPSIARAAARSAAEDRPAVRAVGEQDLARSKRPGGPQDGAPVFTVRRAAIARARLDRVDAGLSVRFGAAAVRRDRRRRISRARPIAHRRPDVAAPHARRRPRSRLQQRQHLRQSLAPRA